MSDFDEWEGVFVHGLAQFAKVVVIVDSALVADSDDGKLFANVTSDS
jgi:hypothetical protein